MKEASEAHYKEDKISAKNIPAKGYLKVEEFLPKFSGGL